MKNGSEPTAAIKRKVPESPFPPQGASDAEPAAVSRPAIENGAMAFDAAAIALSGTLASRLWVAEFGKTWPAVAVGLIIVLAIALAGLRWHGAYTFFSLGKATRQLALTSLWLVAGLAGLIVSAHILGWPVNSMRYWLVFWFVAGWTTVAANRMALGIWLKAKRKSRIPT